MTLRERLVIYASFLIAVGVTYRVIQRRAMTQEHIYKAATMDAIGLVILTDQLRISKLHAAYAAIWRIK